jgi:uncharacterized protein (UPF0332 family)
MKYLMTPIGVAIFVEKDNASCTSCETCWRGVLLKRSLLNCLCQQQPALLEFSATMAAIHDYLAKAHENLASAESELQHGRTNSCARSAYYACFHAAIAALLYAGLTAPEPARGWGHDWVHASFVGQLIQRRKLDPANLRRILSDLLALRHKGDYRATRVSQREAQHVVRSAQTLVQAVAVHLQGQGGSA